jgi:hypothetical protein
MDIGADVGSSPTPGRRDLLGFGVLRGRVGDLDDKFDLILHRGMEPASGVVNTRTYRAGHNLGVYRFVGYSAVDDAGRPEGDFVPLAEVRFPFDPFLQGRHRLDGTRHRAIVALPAMQVMVVG